MLFTPYYEEAEYIKAEEGENAIAYAEKKLAKAEDEFDVYRIAYWTSVLNYIKENS